MGAYLEFEGEPLRFDAVLSEQGEHSSKPTEHNVEQGADVTDHVRPGLAKFSLEVFVSNQPVKDVNDLWSGEVKGLELDVKTFDKTPALSPGGLIQAVADQLSSLISGKTSWKATTLQWPQAFDNQGYVLNKLLDWKDRVVLGKVITRSRSYENMIIVQVTPNRAPDLGDGMKINIELQEIRLVETAMITSPVPTEPRGQVAVAKGKQPTGPVKDPAPKKSLLLKLLKG